MHTAHGYPSHTRVRVRIRLKYTNAHTPIVLCIYRLCIRFLHAPTRSTCFKYAARDWTSVKPYGRQQRAAHSHKIK